MTSLEQNVQKAKQILKFIYGRLKWIISFYGVQHHTSTPQ